MLLPPATYLDFPAVEALCRSFADRFPRWCTLEEVGRSRQGRPLWLLTLGDTDGPRDQLPALWLDGGTHASEWAGVMGVLHTVDRWLHELPEEQTELAAWFRRHTVYALPCISPDGYQALHEGAPFLRSTLRPPRPNAVRSGFSPGDLDGDGVVRWMRWRHPAGPFVPDEEVPLLMRPRTLDDPDDRAYFVASEGSMLRWDGVRWVQAPLEHGLDLNRNFPGHWDRFSMFGMDGGEVPMSEPESRAVVDALRARPNVSAAITQHTFTGCLLTQPYRPDTPLDDADIGLMEALANDACADTGYRVIRSWPDFTYDDKATIRGVWSDTLGTLFGVAGYTLELWNPYGEAGFEVDEPARFFREPKLEQLRKLVARYADEPGTQPWTPFDHPQLGPVDIGGLDLLRTVRNPPPGLLPAELSRAFMVCERARRSLPELRVTVHHEQLGEETHRLRAVFENVGFLHTSGLKRAEQIGLDPGVRVELTGGELLDGERQANLGHLDGWGSSRVGWGSNPLWPMLPARGNRAVRSWVVRGPGQIALSWASQRAGAGRVEVAL